MKATDRFLYHIVKAFIRLSGSLPAPVRTFLATALGRLFFTLGRQRRNITIANLTTAFGTHKSPRQIRIIARKVYENLCRIIFEVGWAMALTDQEFPKYFTISGFSCYQRAIARGRGVLLLSGHFGNWELMPIVAHMCRMPVGIVYRPMDAVFLDRFFKENRSRFGGTPIPTHRGAMQKIYRALRKGHPVGMLMDQGADWYDGVFVDFFGRRAATNTGMALLALKTKAPVVPLFLIRKQDGFHAEFGPELPLIQTGDRQKDIEENCLLYTNVIEAYARRFPQQWFWLHQRWKNRPYCQWPRKKKSKKKKR